MPVLGAGGVLELRRELPEPALFSTEAVTSHANAVDLVVDGYWTGDKVWLWGPVGLPFDLNDNGIPDVRSGWGMFYGSRLGLYGPRATRLTSGSGKWFGTEAPFLPPEDEVVDRREFYVYRDALDRLSFYLTLSEAMEGSETNRLRIYPVDFRFLLITPAGSTGYQQRLEPVYPELADYRLPEGVNGDLLSNASTAAVPEPTGLDDDRPWRFVAEMDDWSLELTGEEARTNGLGDKFGESVKTMITGSGTVNFFINRTEHGSELDSTFLARLLLLLEKGAKSEGIFNLTKKRSTTPYVVGNRRLPIADTSYRAEMLFVSNAVDTRAEDVIRGSARFVTVGRIRLDIS